MLYISPLGIERGSASPTLHYDIPSLNPRVYLGFKSLKVLTFKYVDVAQDVLEYFLSNFPALGQLSVFHSPSLVNLRVVSPSISLKSLEIQGCKNIGSIEICDVKLVSFSYVGNEISLLVRNVPRLIEVSISEECICNNFIEVAFIQLSRCLSQLEILKLCGRVAYKRDHVFPILASLKHLEFTFLEDDSCSLLELTSILRASPSLHRLVLYVKMDYTTSKRRKINYNAPKCSHNNLKVVELVGYEGHKSDFELVKFLAKTAGKLEKIVIKGHEGENTWRKMARDIAREKLKEKLPSTVDFVYTA